MLVCVDAGNEKGTGTNLLTKGKKYEYLGSFGGYYNIMCDDGIVRTKDKTRFEFVRNRDLHL